VSVPVAFLATPVDEHMSELFRSALVGLEAGVRRAEPQSGDPPRGRDEPPARAAAVTGADGGRPFGPYRVTREIGRGGMGTVYEAERADRRYDRRVAIKTVTIGAPGGLLTRRFEDECRILSGLEHPNIGRLYDAGTTPEGVPYLVMEFVEGRRIDTWCDEERLSVEDRLELFDRVCEAVEYAHGKLVVHRDLKPGNILVTDEGVPRLLDFGVARLLVPGPDAQATAGAYDSAPPAPAADPTLAGFRALTPEYASPEQLRGEPVTTAADVYALGVLLYLLLSGSPPHRFENRSPDDVERTIRERPAPPPSEAAATDDPARRGRLRGDLDSIVLTAIRPDVDARYASVGRLRADLRNHLSGFPVSARPAIWRYRAARFARRHRAGLTAASLVFLALAAGLAGTAWQARAAARQAARAELTRDYLIGLFETFDPDEAGIEPFTAEELLDRGAERLERDLAGQPMTRAELGGVLGRLYQRLGLFDKARPLLASARTEVVRAHGELHPVTAAATARLARLLYEARELEEAEPLARAALDARRRLFGEGDTAVANSLNDLAEIRGARGDLDEAEAMHAEALAIDRRSGTSDRVATDLDNLGVVVRRAGRHDEATRLLEEALALRRELYGDRHTKVATSLVNVSAALTAAGKYDEAERMLLEALALRRELLGDRHPLLAIVLGNLGNTRQQAGRLEEAEEAHREAVEIRQAVFGDAHPTVARSLNNLAVVTYYRGDYARAAERFAEALAIWEDRLGEDHPDVLSALNNLGAARREAGDYEAAEPVLRDVLTRRRRVLGHDHPSIGQSLNNLAVVLYRQRALDDAERTFHEALDSWRASLGEDHPRLANALDGLGRLLLDQGRCAEGVEPLERAVGLRETALDPESSLLAATRARLGLCLRALGRHDEAASLLAVSLPVLERRHGPDFPLVQRVRAALGPGNR
jgi:serine/threonine-protein kinase